MLYIYILQNRIFCLKKVSFFFIAVLIFNNQSPSCRSADLQLSINLIYRWWTRSALLMCSALTLIRNYFKGSFIFCRDKKLNRSQSRSSYTSLFSKGQAVNHFFPWKEDQDKVHMRLWVTWNDYTFWKQMIVWVHLKKKCFRNMILKSAICFII